MNIKELVKGTTVEFEYFQHGEFWYKVVEKDFYFPVPIDDIGNARMLSRDKGMLFMRYIRKHLATLESGKQ